MRDGGDHHAVRCIGQRIIRLDDATGAERHRGTYPLVDHLGREGGLVAQLRLPPGLVLIEVTRAVHIGLAVSCGVLAGHIGVGLETLPRLVRVVVTDAIGLRHRLRVRCQREDRVAVRVEAGRFAIRQRQRGLIVVVIHIIPEHHHIPVLAFGECAVDPFLLHQYAQVIRSRTSNDCTDSAAVRPGTSTKAC